MSSPWAVLYCRFSSFDEMYLFSDHQTHNLCINTDRREYLTTDGNFCTQLSSTSLFVAFIVTSPLSKTKLAFLGYIKFSVVYLCNTAISTRPSTTMQCEQLLKAIICVWYGFRWDTVQCVTLPLPWAIVAMDCWITISFKCKREACIVQFNQMWIVCLLAKTTFAFMHIAQQTNIIMNNVSFRWKRWHRMEKFIRFLNFVSTPIYILGL